MAPLPRTPAKPPLPQSKPAPLPRAPRQPPRSGGRDGAAASRCWSEECRAQGRAAAGPATPCLQSWRGAATKSRQGRKEWRGEGRNGNGRSPAAQHNGLAGCRPLSFALPAGVLGLQALKRRWPSASPPAFPSPLITPLSKETRDQIAVGQSGGEPRSHGRRQSAHGSRVEQDRKRLMHC